MTGGYLLPLAAVLAAIVAINLVITWLLVHRDRDPSELLGTARFTPENATNGSVTGDTDLEQPENGGAERAGDGERKRPDGEPDGPGEPAEPTVLRTAAGTELTLSGPEDDGEEPPPLDADGETVVCRHCGAENRAGYRYCRWCVRSGFVEDGGDGAAGPAMTDRSL